METHSPSNVESTHKPSIKGVPKVNVKAAVQQQQELLNEMEEL